ncbi:hypothetical protein DM02DRAFT_616851 [Periconia macrospinosa]|uniref:Uncharacterized protein n=1 Tax=Periconia macrospinosa TaxID=97972 RepID=A0A2V1DFS6_9PLEO|nr:hypothetical protein DM02DRAFT_616851 [Periconia macrospinosa]
MAVMNKHNSASKKVSSDTIAQIFPMPYSFLFLVMEPAVIGISLISIVVSPTNHYMSLAPPSSSGLLFSHIVERDVCGFLEAWHTPNIRVLLYQFMAALGFSAIIEPLLLYTARYKMENQKDAERAIAAVLAAFFAFDILHSLATIAVVGSKAVMPSLGMDWSGVDLYAAINFWVPVAWMMARASWFAGLGRRRHAREKVEK